MRVKHIISAEQFDTKIISWLFRLTDKIKSGYYNPSVLQGKIMAALFYEPSTRTRLSFESAMLRLGGKVISTENAAKFSSAIKGETLADTIRIVNGYSDLIVIRHFQTKAAEVASSFSKVPVINAGDGTGEHPTQALLDLYTIFSKFKKGDFTITMVGDLTNGRTIHSLSYLLSLYAKVKIIFVAPRALAIPQNLRRHLKTKKIQFTETENFLQGISKAEVIYQTRIQKERFKNKAEFGKYFGKYILNQDSLKFIKKNAIIMHPLPRVNEISQEVDSDKRAIYFEQAQNGLYIRMALLLYLFDKVQV